EKLIAFRRQEGARLAAFFEEKIAAIQELLNEVPRYEEPRILFAFVLKNAYFCKIISNYFAYEETNTTSLNNIVGRLLRFRTT
ncbi:MAG: hypothetical protein IIT37_12570, partial [Bacteroidales bacterium]|nr:hypothetical protein [Bacteroidales bacterium]